MTSRVGFCNPLLYGQFPINLFQGTKEQTHEKAHDLTYDERERLVNPFECVLHYGLLASLRSLSRFPPFLFTWLEGNSENF